MISYIFECIDCKKQYMPNDVQYVCPKCSNRQKPLQPLLGLIRTLYDYDKIAKQFTVEVLKSDFRPSPARWSELIPINSIDSIPSITVAATPLRPVTRLRRLIGLDALWIKDDTLQATGSYKDRASSMVVAYAKENGHEIIATASTGNAATALAGMAASAGLSSIIFVPSSAPIAKLTQIAIYGGKLMPIKGTYDEAFELSTAACKKFGWYNRNTAYNPITIEGKKTAALEIWEALDYRAPDWVIVPTGDGVILAGIEKGFFDLLSMGLIEKMPRLVAAQADGCKPIFDAWEKHSTDVAPELKPKTIADSISVGVPRAGRWALNALYSTNGVCVAVTDEEIIEAISILGKSSGIFAEPAAATAVAGLKKLAQDGTIKRDDCVVTLVTGNGLKDIAAAQKAIRIPKAIDATLEAVEGAL